MATAIGMMAGLTLLAVEVICLIIASIILIAIIMAPIVMVAEHIQNRKMDKDDAKERILNYRKSILKQEGIIKDIKEEKIKREEEIKRLKEAKDGFWQRHSIADSRIEGCEKQIKFDREQIDWYQKTYNINVGKVS